MSATPGEIQSDNVPKVTLDQVGDYQGKCVCISGWIRHLRRPGKVLFMVIRDGRGLCQAVLEKTDERAELFDAFSRLGQESAIELIGTIRADERAPGGYELAVSDGRVLHAVSDYPIARKAHGVDFLFKHRHLWLRSPRQITLMRIRDTLIWSIRNYFRREGFVLVDTPIFSPSAGEGASTLFKVDYFDEQVYLAQTGQLYLEPAAIALRKVYCFGPTFRAEKSKTRRHLTEFWMVEPEMAFINLDELIGVAEDFICSVVAAVLNEHRKDLEELGRDCSPLENIKKPFVRLKYDQVVDVLHGKQAEQLLTDEQKSLENQIDQAERKLQELDEQAAGTKTTWQKEKLAGEAIELRDQLTDLREQAKYLPHHLELARNFAWGQDLGGSDETIISKLHDRPVFVTHYPRNAKAFYMRQDRDRDDVVENFDLLAPEGYGEIIGGSMREDELDRLLQRMDEEHLPREPYEWYLDLRRYGSVPHGGFGLGVERTLAWLCGLKHIREAIAFPRMMDKLYP